MEKTQQEIQKQANKHCREPDFGLGDKVWITTRNWKTERPSCKLDHQIARLYKILEKIRHAYRIKLPNSIRVHPVFSPDRLCKASDDLLPGQKKDPPPPVEVSRKEECVTALAQLYWRLGTSSARLQPT